ncbi:MAG: DUF1211 domain-containing protein [Phycisphaerales bacterium]|nr:DUF1211 domain-containing protein [Phycisphaerales bacterium]
MGKGRLEAFSDGVLAIIITIMVLELKVPGSTDLGALVHLLPHLLAYLLSFIYLGIYWNNHHHMFQVTRRVTGGILWANLHLLFWLSLIPFATGWLAMGWMGPRHEACLPAAVYGAVLLLSALAYTLLQTSIIRDQADDAALARAVGRDRKGKISLVGYAAAIPLAFLNPWIAVALFVLVAGLWVIPDRRIERAV